MSTKIYTGHKLKEGIELTTLTTKLKALREIAQDALIDAVVEFIKEPKEYLKACYYEKRDGEKNTALTEILDHLGLDDLSIVIYLQHLHEGKVLATIHGGNILKNEITESEQFKELFDYYGYWNNVDPDENCSDEEWQQREKDWDFINVPSEDGFVYTLIDKHDTLGSRLYFAYMEKFGKVLEDAEKDA